MDDGTLLPDNEMIQELETKANKYFDIMKIIRQRIDRITINLMRVFALIIPVTIFFVGIFINNPIVWVGSVALIIAISCSEDTSVYGKLKTRLRVQIERNFYANKIVALKNDVYNFISNHSEEFEWVVIDPEMFEYYSFRNLVIDYYESKK